MLYSTALMVVFRGCAVMGVVPTIYDWLSARDKDGNYKYPNIKRQKKYQMNTLFFIGLKWGRGALRS